MHMDNATLFPNKQIHLRFLLGGTGITLNTDMMEPKYKALIGPFSSLSLSSLWLWRLMAVGGGHQRVCFLQHITQEAAVEGPGSQW